MIRGALTAGALIVYLAFYSNPSLLSKLPYDSVRDFAPVVSLASSASVLVVHPSVPAKNLTELIALAKARPGLDATTWRGLLTPAEAITKLNAEVNKALAHAPLRTRLEELGYDASGGTADEYAKLVRSEITQWESVIRKAGIGIE